MDDVKTLNGSVKSGAGGANGTTEDGDNDDSDEDKENEIGNHEGGTEGGMLQLIGIDHESIT